VRLLNAARQFAAAGEGEIGRFKCRSHWVLAIGYFHHQVYKDFAALTTRRFVSMMRA
jgi:hypothetical protein